MKKNIKIFFNLTLLDISDNGHLRCLHIFQFFKLLMVKHLWNGLFKKWRDKGLYGCMMVVWILCRLFHEYKATQLFRFLLCHLEIIMFSSFWKWCHKELKTYIEISARKVTFFYENQALLSLEIKLPWHVWYLSVILILSIRGVDIFC